MREKEDIYTLDNLHFGGFKTDFGDEIWTPVLKDISIFFRSPFFSSIEIFVIQKTVILWNAFLNAWRCVSATLNGHKSLKCSNCKIHCETKIRQIINLFNNFNIFTESFEMRMVRSSKWKSIFRKPVPTSQKWLFSQYSVQKRVLINKCERELVTSNRISHLVRILIWIVISSLLYFGYFPVCVFSSSSKYSANDERSVKST